MTFAVRVCLLAALFSASVSEAGVFRREPDQPTAYPLPEVRIQFGGGYDGSDFDSYRDQAEQGYAGATGGRSLSADAAAAAEALGIDLSAVRQYVTTAVAANPTSTGLIQRMVEDSDRDCARSPRAYRVSCVQDRFQALSRQLPRRGDYAVVRAALTEVSTELAKIARAERDRSVPRARIALSGGRRTGPLTGVTAAGSARAAEAVRAARARLLRSVPSSDPRHRHYQRIATAFQSTAVLLRS